jgi:hypothetical protein
MEMDNRKPAKQFYVYFVSAKVDGYPIKIGLTTGAMYRFQTLKNAMPYEIDILGYMAVDHRSAERALHQQFSHIRLKGEWFTRTPELMGFIGGLSLERDLPSERKPPAVDIDAMFAEMAELARSGAYSAAMRCEYDARTWPRSGS